MIAMISLSSRTRQLGLYIYEAKMTRPTSLRLFSSVPLVDVAATHSHQDSFDPPGTRIELLRGKCWGQAATSDEGPHFDGVI